jgi:hypothetical protein
VQGSTPALTPTDRSHNRRPLRGAALLAAALVLALPLFAAPSALGAYQTINSAGPIEQIFVGDDLTCQARYAGDAEGEFYGGELAPASCDTRLALGGQYQSGVTPVSQSGVTGSGSSSDPYRVETVADVGGLRITEVTTYIVGRDFYRTDATIANSGEAAIDAVLFHSADCYLQGAAAGESPDDGYGFFDASTGGIYCTRNPNNSPPARVEGFVPQSPGSSYWEGHYSDRDDQPTGYANTCDCDTVDDNGAGLSWPIRVPAFGSVTISFLTAFSPSGAVVDNSPPPVTLTTPADGSSTTDTTPTLSGAAGSEPGDSQTVTVRIFNGSDTSGSPEQTLSASVSNGAWSVDAAPLALGTHTAQAEQSDSSGNVGQSAAVNFTVLPAASRRVDQDGDGVPDTTDACPTVPAFTENGCPLPDPVIGKTINVEPVRGKVFVAVPSKTARASASVPGLKGLRFVALRAGRQIPVGSFLDTRRGTVQLSSAKDSSGKTQVGTFLGGVFQSLQSRSGRQRGLTELKLKGASFSGCGAAGSRHASAALSRRTIRRLSGSARGSFRTRGRYSAATVRGTKWTVTDRCDGTLTKVTRGTVAVRDFRRRKTITVRAGKSYLARAQRPAPRRRAVAPRRPSFTG